MAEAYVKLIINGMKSFKDVPDTLKPEVKEKLIERGYKDLTK